MKRNDLFFMSLGLKLAIEQVTKGRRNNGAKPVVVLMTDGDWNRGSDPITEVNILKKQLNVSSIPHSC